MATKVIGLTGGIASGKSTVARLLRELGAPVVDADLLAREIVRPGRPAHAEIVAEFGPEVLAPDGTIDRKQLGEIVFADPTRRRRLEEITHPRITAAARDEVAGHVARGEPVVFYEAALLVENGFHRALDGLVVVSARPEQQLLRVMARDGVDEAHARARLASQLPLADKLAVATDVVDNSGSVDEVRRQVEALWRRLRSSPEPARPA